MANNRERALQVFRTFDVNSTGKITHDQFKAGIVITSFITNTSLLYFLMLSIITGFVIYFKILLLCRESFLLFAEVINFVAFAFESEVRNVSCYGFISTCLLSK